MSSSNKMILIGGLVGAVVGATAAWAYAKAQESKLSAAGAQAGLRLRASAPDYVKVGMALLTLVRQVVDLFKPA